MTDLGWQHLRQLLQREKDFTPAGFDRLCKESELFHSLAVLLNDGRLSTQELMGLISSRNDSNKPGMLPDPTNVPLAFQSVVSSLFKMVSRSKMNHDHYSGWHDYVWGREYFPSQWQSFLRCDFGNYTEKAIARLISSGDWLPAVTFKGFNPRAFDKIFYKVNENEGLQELVSDSSLLDNIVQNYSELMTMQTGLCLYYTGDFTPFSFDRDRVKALEGLRTNVRERHHLNLSSELCYANVLETFFLSMMHLITPHGIKADGIKRRGTRLTVPFDKQSGEERSLCFLINDNCANSKSYIHMNNLNMNLTINAVYTRLPMIKLWSSDK